MGEKAYMAFEEDFDTARQMYDQVEGAGAFMALAEKEREKLCYHAILCELDAGVTLRAVKFVSYDEALYERLVEINAIAKNGTAQVQTEDTELGWPHTSSIVQQLCHLNIKKCAKSFNYILSYVKYILVCQIKPKLLAMSLFYQPNNSTFSMAQMIGSNLV